MERSTGYTFGMQDLLKRTVHLKKNFRVEKYIHAALTNNERG